MGNYKGYTPAHSKAHSNYISKFARIEIRTTTETREAIQAHAEGRGESVNGFVNRAISEAMERDNAAQNGPGGHAGTKEEDT